MHQITYMRKSMQDWISTLSLKTSNIVRVRGELWKDGPLQAGFLVVKNLNMIMNMIFFVKSFENEDESAIQKPGNRKDKTCQKI